MRVVGSPPIGVFFLVIFYCYHYTLWLTPETYYYFAPVISSVALVVEMTFSTFPRYQLFHHSYAPRLRLHEAPDSSDRLPSQDPYVMVVARWRSKVASRPSSSSEFPIAPVTALPGIRRRSAILIRSGGIPFGRPYQPTSYMGRAKLLMRGRASCKLYQLVRLLGGSASSSFFRTSASSSSSSSLDSLPVHSSGLDAPDQAQFQIF
ncbi:hypothetical protein Tco_0437730 [Tanacetum coccineum]